MGMNDLEAAAREAVGRVQTLLETVGEAERECHEALGYVQILGEQLGQDRLALDEAAEALAATSDASEAQLADATGSAAGALSVAASAFRQAGEDGPSDLDAEATAAGNAATLLTELGPRVRDVADAAEAASRAAIEQAVAIAQALEDVVEKIEQVVGVEFASLVADAKRQLETAAEEVLELMNVTVVGALDRREMEWYTKLAIVRDLLDTSCDRVEQHTQEVAVHTAGTWSRQVDDELTGIESEAQTVIAALASLTQLVDNNKGQLQVAAEMVVEGLGQAAEGAGVVEREIDHTRGRWGLFGITT